uniref:Uncharacterized protein n=1 Tax=Cryptomonas curvata TaxID=233186 RepID=A0A6T8BNH8_9CRYP|mmetsp:Transcript_51457/g.107495  ORF Transcript_51457/g.107495 Transcript_51457/m.107495 type:complete len:297 (+) Transcript_51457:2-892(+)
MALGEGRLWNASQKSLLITVSLACVVAVTVSLIYGYDHNLEASSQSVLLQKKGSRSHTAAMKERLAWAKEAALSDAQQRMPGSTRSNSISNGNTGFHHSLKAMERQNQQLEQEILRARAASHTHDMSLNRLEGQNAKLKAEVNAAKARSLKIQNRKLTMELKLLQQGNSRKGGRTSSLASYPVFTSVSASPTQSLAWYGPKDKYGAISRVPGFNPLSMVTRSDKSIDPDYRPPLRAPEPSGGDLSETVTGDYASYNTYSNLVDNKDNILWCSQEFDYLPSRIECIKRLDPAGPFLN